MNLREPRFSWRLMQRVLLLGIFWSWMAGLWPAPSISEGISLALGRSRFLASLGMTSGASGQLGSPSIHALGGITKRTACRLGARSCMTAKARRYADPAMKKGIV